MVLSAGARAAVRVAVMPIITRLRSTCAQRRTTGVSVNRCRACRGVSEAQPLVASACGVGAAHAIPCALSACVSCVYRVCVCGMCFMERNRVCTALEARGRVLCAPQTRLRVQRSKSPEGDRVEMIVFLWCLFVCGDVFLCGGGGAHTFVHVRGAPHGTVASRTSHTHHTDEKKNRSPSEFTHRSDTHHTRFNTSAMR